MNVVLQAPPGAGKTTLVPPALLEEKWLGPKKIILLQPRRLATRAAARRMAALLKETVGRQVGYRIRFDNRVGKETRIEVVTEAVLTRKLQKDPELADTGLVIFDEFHERNIHSDLGLALCREVQAELRPDLRILVMSATLDQEPVARILGRCEVIACSGRQYPVKTHYLDRPVSKPEPAFIAGRIDSILGNDSGSMLAFLPGAGEIRRVAALLKKKHPPADLDVVPLYGDLPGKQQDLAIKPSPAGRRKVVLATSIAETSLTIEGIRIVVDAGMMRIPRFNPGSLMTVLETVRVSRASADQRRGRAGRTEPGSCYRLWTEHDHNVLNPFNKPEILITDLCPLALELACWGNTATDALAWLDPPPAAALEQAWNFLQGIGAVDSQRKVTRHGRKISALGVHPRLGHMILEGDAGRLSTEMAALISQRDILRRGGPGREVDIRARLEILHNPQSRQGGIDPHAVRRVSQLAGHWRKLAKPRDAGGSTGPDEAGRVLALAYPDRIGKLRPGSRSRYLLSGGRGAVLPEDDPLCGEPFLTVARTNGQTENARIYLAAPVRPQQLERSLGNRITVEETVAWDSRRKTVVCRIRRMIGKVVLRDRELKKPDSQKVGKCLLTGVREAGLKCLPLSREDLCWIDRVQFVRKHGREEEHWPDLSEQALLDDLENWLLPYVSGIRNLSALKKLPMKKILGSRLNWEQVRRLDKLAPRKLSVPSGSRIRLDYRQDGVPVLAVRLQEVLGLKETPAIFNGKVKVLLHLLSPAGRPVQVTRDLEGFWKGAYGDVRKEMRGRYPKHYWPENPLEAVATRRVRPRARGKRT